MTVHALLSRLDLVKRTGPETHIARCPGPLHKHGDRHPSLSIREKPDGIVLLKCWAGCDVEEILGAVSLTFDALFPEKPIEHGKPERRPFFPSDVFELALREITIAAVIAADLHKNRAVDETGYERLLTCCGRLNNIAEGAYGK